MTILTPFTSLLDQAKDQIVTAIATPRKEEQDKADQAERVAEITSPNDMVAAVMQGTLQAAALDLASLGYLAPAPTPSEPPMVDGGTLTSSLEAGANPEGGT